MEDLERLWPRVTGRRPPPPPGPPPPPPPPPRPPRPGPPPPPPPPPDREDARALEARIRDEAEAERRYRALAARTRGRSSQTLSALAAGSRRLLRRMQQAYFLRTGDSAPLPPERRPAEGTVQEELRRAWNDAREAEKRYLRDSADTRDPELRALFADGAALKQRQQAQLRALIHRMF